MNNYYIFLKGDSSSRLEFNVTKTIRRELSTEVTMSPIENGSNVADHVRNMPVKITFTGVLVQQDPINEGSIGYEEYLAVLNEWRDRKYLLSVWYDDSLDPDTNMFIKTFTMDRDSKISDGWNVSMSLQQVEVATEAVITDALENVVSDDVKPKVQIGKVKNVQTKQVTEEQETKIDYSSASARYRARRG